MICNEWNHRIFCFQNQCASGWHIDIDQQKRLLFIWKTRKFREKKSNGSVHSGGNFPGKKVIPFEVLPFSHFYGNDRNFLYRLFGLPSARLHVERKQKFTGTLKMVQLNPVPVFVAKKYTSTIWRKFCTKISVQMVNTPGDVSVGGPRDLPVTRSESAYQSSKPFIGLAQL